MFIFCYVILNVLLLYYCIYLINKRAFNRNINYSCWKIRYLKIEVYS